MFQNQPIKHKHKHEVIGSDGEFTYGECPCGDIDLMDDHGEPTSECYEVYGTGSMLDKLADRQFVHNFDYVLFDDAGMKMVVCGHCLGMEGGMTKEMPVRFNLICPNCKQGCNRVAQLAERGKPAMYRCEKCEESD